MYRYSYGLPLVFMGVPVPGKYNPYIVLVSSEASLVVEVEVEEAEGGSPRLRLLTRGLGWRLELALKSFLDTVSARLEAAIEASIGFSWRGVEYPPSASLYAAASLALLDAVSREAGYELKPEELIEAARSVDHEAGVWLDYLDGLRVALVRGRGLVYRHGEEPVELGLGLGVRLELVGEEDIGGDITGEMSDVLLSNTAKLLGNHVVELVSGLRSGGTLEEKWRVAARVENAAYYMLYGVEPPPEGCKWTPSLQRVYGVCSPGSGAGEEVEFTL